MSKSEVGTIMTSRPLLHHEAWCEAILKATSDGSLDDAYRSLGLTGVCFWLQRKPDRAVVRWEGTEIDTMLERFSVSSHPVLGYWRGRLRVFSGPEPADEFWDASRDRLFSWSSGEAGVESAVTIYSGVEQVEAYRRQAMDFQAEPALMGVLDRVRSKQGFTRIETWHQQSPNGDGLLLTLAEAHNLKDAFGKLFEEDNDLDKRTMKLLRGTLFKQMPPPTPAELVARWTA